MAHALSVLVSGDIPTPHNACKISSRFFLGLEKKQEERYGLGLAVDCRLSFQAEVFFLKVHIPVKLVQNFMGQVKSTL